MPFSFQSLQSKILGLVILGVGLLSASAFWAMFSLSSSIKQYDHLFTVEIGSASLARDISVNFKTQVQEWKNTLLRGHDDANRDKYWGRFLKQHNKIQDLVADLNARSIPDDVRADVESFKQSHLTMLSAYKKGYQAYIDSGYDFKAGDKAVKGIDRAPSKSIEAVASRLVELSVEKSKTAHDDGVSAVRNSMIEMVLMLVVVTVLLGVFLNRKIVHPMLTLIHRLTEISEGKYDNPIVMERDDELGEMVVALEKTRKNLAVVTDDLLNTSHNLDDVSDTLDLTANTIAKGAEEQGQRTDSVATAMHQMSMSALGVSTNAGEAAEAANLADTSSNEALSVMAETIKVISDSSQQIQDTAGVIGKLDEDARQIGTVLDVIKSIAEQTNLLALNAAIEAARAGEQGRGFAVVADEVRTLAQRTQESTLEIQEIINNVQMGAENANKAIENGQQQSSVSVQMVEKANGALETITHAISTIRQMNAQIATGAQEQSTVAEDITNSLHTLKEISDTNQTHSMNCVEGNRTLTSLNSRLKENLAQLTGH